MRPAYTADAVPVTGIDAVEQRVDARKEQNRREIRLNEKPVRRRLVNKLGMDKLMHHNIESLVYPDISKLYLLCEFDRGDDDEEHLCELKDDHDHNLGMPVSQSTPYLTEHTPAINSGVFESVCVPLLCVVTSRMERIMTLTICNTVINDATALKHQPATRW